MIIEIANLQKHFEIKKNKIKGVVEEVLGKEGKDANLSFAFVDNNEIRNLNKRYFDSDEVTDVIAFPLSNQRNVISGEIIVSVETAVDTAGKGRIDIEGEIILYVVHGLLHLLGYRDDNREDSIVMHDKESRILKKLGYNVPKVEDGFLY
ncbi:MAG: rRNA maturation RNase YbeY [Candidatus Brocadiaceae bacterium]|nr:rRNA maturation RNase YbeY [Candidatus Brocadiaceae bacterium]